MDLSTLILPLNNIAICAGKIILTYYKNLKNIEIKDDNSPLTEADLESNAFIIKKLKQIDPAIPILTEESLVEWSARKKWSTYWLVDPLDGTKEFINQNGEFTVNIALIQNNKPTLGIIYAPALSTLYYAYKNFGSYKLSCSNILNNLDDSKKIHVNKKNKSDHLLVIGSRSHSNENFNRWIDDNIENYEIVKKGSSLKFCNIADGNADIYPRFGLTSEWDIAAGQIILKEAGGDIKSIDNKEIVYNTKENILNPYFIASGMATNE